MPMQALQKEKDRAYDTWVEKQAALLPREDKQASPLAQPVSSRTCNACSILLMCNSSRALPIGEAFRLC